jgi:hypothetical protein
MPDPTPLLPVETLTAEQEHKLKRENARLRKQLEAALEEKVLNETYEAFITDCLERSRRAMPPVWTRPTAAARRHQVIPVTLFSDWHFDEVVRPEEVQQRNAYNREIALRRLRRYFAGVCKVAHEYVHSFHYPGIVIAMLGDVFSGNIHEELRNTNADKIMGSLLYWLDPVCSGLQMLADAFGKVWVVSVVGNHGRNTVKPIAKQRVRDNFDWLFARLLEKIISRGKLGRHVEWLIADAQKQPFSLYDTRFIASHGDEARGGSGIAGMLSPQLIAAARMRKTYSFDIWVLGHWHYLSAYRGIRVNGSGKGWDEFAQISNFDYQRPMQDFFLVAPQAGVIASWPIFCEEPEDAPRARRSGEGPQLV